MGQPAPYLLMLNCIQIGVTATLLGFDGIRIRALVTQSGALTATWPFHNLERDHVAFHWSVGTIFVDAQLHRNWGLSHFVGI